MTITEKIIAAHAERRRVTPGEIVEVKPDLVLTNDISGPLLVDAFEKMGADRVYDPNKVVVILDHFTPNKDISAARASSKMREFVKRLGIGHFYDAGYGIEHVVLPELGLVKPGDLIVGGDSHTVTYGGLGAFATGVGSTDLAACLALGEIWLKVPQTVRFEFSGKPGRWIGGKDLILMAIGRVGVSGALYCAMEFGGEAVSHLSIDGRLTMCNMAIEAGAKAGIVEPDEKTLDWLRETYLRLSREGVWYGEPEPNLSDSLLTLRSDPDCEYKVTEHFDVTHMEPQVAIPHLPSEVRPVSDVRDIEVHQVVIGSCTNGRISDLRAAAEVLKNKKVSKWVRTIVIPGSQNVYRQALKEGILEVLNDAGAVICEPTCGPCFGGHTGVLDAGERCVSTTNRNFVGRMGHEKSEVYLAGPYVAAASAIAGRIVHPEEV